MSEKTFTICKAYALSAIDKTGKRVYYDTDSHSGGYPYWSTSFNQRKTWESLDKIPTIGPKDYMRNEVTSIEVLEVKVQAKIVSSTELVSEAKAKAMAEIDKIQKELARKISALETMK
jgi:hypothetical protein